ncbi:MAG: RDD family protein [Methanobacterium sp.]|nr:RDD family protein [Methanobacterium sp.]
MYCPKCGIKNQKDDNFCSYCGEEIRYRNLMNITDVNQKTENNDEGFKREINSNYSGFSENSEFELASLGRRIIAYLVDMFVLVIIVTVVLIPIFIIQYIYFSYDEILMELVSNLLFVFIMFGYFIVMEGPLGKGRTIGKMALKLRVIKEKDNSRISYGQSIVRNLLRIVDGFFFYIVGMILISSSKKNQRLGDNVAKTLVITEKRE